MDDAARAELAHLLRRTAFAPTVAELDGAVRAGYPATVAGLLQPGPAGLPASLAAAAGGGTPGAPGGTGAAAAARQKAQRGQVDALRRAWLDLMTGTTTPAVERRTFFWHGHFATSATKVHLAAYLAQQNQALRGQGLAGFDALTLAAVRGPAMLQWLDAGDNRAAHPNENLGRELLELFTLGVGNYTETDVREAARALTGWALVPATGQVTTRPALHDHGPKTVLGVTGNFDGTDLVQLVTRRPQSARWVARRIWGRFVAPVDAQDRRLLATIDAVADSADTTSDGAVQLADLWRRVLLGAAFRDPAVRGTLVAEPVDWAVGAMRQLGLRAGQHADLLDRTLRALGQVPLEPPNVGGWPTGRAWLSTSAVLVRAAFAEQVSAVADLSAVADQPVPARVEATGHLLAIPQWSPTTREALESAAGAPPQLVALALCSPEYLTR